MAFAPLLFLFLGFFLLSFFDKLLEEKIEFFPFSLVSPFQFRRKHALHSYYVPVQVNCHSLTDSVNNPELFEEDDQEKLDKQRACKLLFSERSLIMNAGGNVLISPKSLKKALPSSRKGINGMKNQGLKMLRRSHTWHNPTDIFETGNLSKKLPKIK